MKAKRTSVELPSPAWQYQLLAGPTAAAGIRLPGWPQLFMAVSGEPSDAQVVARYGEALTALAQANEFQAFFRTGRPPAGEGFRRWQQQFLATHQY
jgi:hypothetical protein